LGLVIFNRGEKRFGDWNHCFVLDFYVLNFILSFITLNILQQDKKLSF